VRAGGRWDVARLGAVDPKLRALAPNGVREAAIDLAGLETLDTVGAWIIHRTQRTLAAQGIAVSLVGADPTHGALIERIEKSDVPPPLARPEPNVLLEMLERTGRALLEAVRTLGALLGFVGHVVTTGLRLLVHPSRVRMTSLVNHLEKVGLNAIPIVGLLSFLIGMVIAFQGADQLRRFGAEVFTVNLLGVSILRELGGILTAIIVAGRSGSAFTAQIGTMQVNEEVDAIRTIGLDPVELLVLPRVTALVIALPLLTIYADVMGLVGGLVMAVLVLDMTVLQFAERLQQAVPLWSFWVGLIKAPVFGLLIGMVGCREGLAVQGGAESVGT